MSTQLWSDCWLSLSGDQAQQLALMAFGYREAYLRARAGDMAIALNLTTNAHSPQSLAHYLDWQGMPVPSDVLAAVMTGRPLL